MIMSADDIALAEKLTLRRARGMIILGIFFLVTMANTIGVEPTLSRPQNFKVAAWIVWAAVLLVVLAIGGGLARGKTVRALMNDDSTVENRRNAMVAGFWATVIAAFALYGISYWAPVSGRDAIRLLLSAAAGVSVIRFGILELRSLRND
jgi:protein-S-isoprenylcysteine O-methyltransferase Ste14